MTNLSISTDSITAKSEYCAQLFSNVRITEYFFSKPVTENRFLFQTPHQACHDTQKEQTAKNNENKSNRVIQQLPLQAFAQFAQEIDLNQSKNFNQGSQNPAQFPAKAKSCPQPTRNQSSAVVENIQLQTPQYT